MFKRKEDSQDALHELNIKRGVTSHFAKTLKTVQQKHLQADGEEFIYSNDYSNNLCNALEAVFLHGLKDSVAQKNFWAVATKFTHSDVTTQLKALAQVSTNVGLCRAWIRLALNDGLMTSYLHSMVVDTKTIKNFYHSHAYLRDNEQPGILKNYLTGLMSLEFKLSCNSSVLNNWSNTTLQLAGLLDTNGASPPHQSAPPLRLTLPSSEALESAGRGVDVPSAVVTSPSSEEIATSVSKKRRDKILEQDDEPIVMKRKGSKGSQDSKVKPMFSSIKDVEEIRRQGASAAAKGGNTASEDSSSSFFSCPDNNSAQSEAEETQSDSPKNNPENDTEHISRYDNSSSVTHLKEPIIDSKSFKSMAAKMEDSTIESSIEKLDIEAKNVPPISKITPSSISRPNMTLYGSPVVTEAAATLQEIYANPRRPRSRRVDLDDLSNLSPVARSFITPSATSITKQKPISENEDIEDSIYSSKREDDNSDEEGNTSRDIPGRVLQSQSDNIAISYPRSEPFSPPDSVAASFSSVGDVNVLRNYEEICAGLPPVKLNQTEQDDVLRKVLQEMDIQADYEKAKEVRRLAKQDTQGPVAHQRFSTGLSLSESDHTLMHSGETISQYGSQLEESNDVSKVNKPEQVPESIKEDELRSEEDDQRVSSQAQDIFASYADTMQGYLDTSEEHFKEDPSEVPSCESPGHIGNSLGSMSGWSSEKGTHRAKAKGRAESFATMLKTYQTSSEIEVPTGTTMEEVILSLTPTDHLDGVMGSRSKEDVEDDGEGDFQRQDSCLDDFEILQSPDGLGPDLMTADSSRMIFLYIIARECGLSHQNFTCKGCTRPIGIIYGPPRLCEFDGGLYCFECHENNESYIPASVIHNWDFSKKKVCVANYKFLQGCEDQALYDIGKLNPRLYAHVGELEDLRNIRQQLCFLKSYMFTCSQKSADSLRQKVWPREHLYDNKDVYSVTDLLQVQSGVLLKLLKEVSKFASLHVYDCPLCSQKGFICEICGNPKVIYPFEMDTTVRCGSCKSVFHKTCLTETIPCPKCQRWGRKGGVAVGVAGVVASGWEDHPEDYGSSPQFK